MWVKGLKICLFLARACVCMYIFVYLRQFFSFSESESHADYEVIDLEEDTEEELQERVARLRTCQSVSYWEGGKAVAATGAEAVQPS